MANETDNPPKKVLTTKVVRTTGHGIRIYGGVLRDFGAPKLAELTECNAPEIPEWPKHQANVILNDVFCGIELPAEVRPYILNMMRRMETAVGEYRLGREMLQAYVDELPRRNNHFLQALRALSHFEQSAAALYQAAQLTRPITKEQLFENNDGSPEQRLNVIYNRSKHFDEPVGSLPPAVPVWLTNEGLECSSAALSFAELHGIILDITKCCECVAVDLPRKVEEKRKAAQKE